MTPSLWAPRAASVDLVTPGGRHPLTRGDDGWWRGGPDLADGDRYAFSLDGGDPRPDPRGLRLPDGPHGSSAVFDVAALTWTDDDWQGYRARRLGGLRDARGHLHARGDARRGGREAALPRRPRRRRGRAAAPRVLPGPAQLGLRRRRAVLRARGVRRSRRPAPVRGRRARPGPGGLPRRGLQPPRSRRELPGRDRAVLRRRLRHPVGPGASTSTAPDSHEVRRWILDNVPQWLRDFHVDGLRLDAVHELHDETRAAPARGDVARGRRAAADDRPARCGWSPSPTATTRGPSPRAAPATWSAGSACTASGPTTCTTPCTSR